MAFSCMARLTPSLPWSAAKLQFRRRCHQDIGTVMWELQFRGSDGTHGELLPELQLPLELHCVRLRRQSKTMPYLISVTY